MQKLSLFVGRCVEGPGDPCRPHQHTTVSQPHRQRDRADRETNQDSGTTVSYPFSFIDAFNIIGKKGMETFYCMQSIEIFIYFLGLLWAFQYVSPP